MKEQANVDSEKTVVINAPRSLVSEENEFLLEARSRYVGKVLAHKSIGVGFVERSDIGKTHKEGACARL